MSATKVCQGSITMCEGSAIKTDLVRVYDIRPTRGGNLSGMVAFFGGVLSFRCVVIDGRAVLGEDVLVFFRKRNVTGDFRKRIAERMMRGSEGAPGDEDAPLPQVTVYDCRRIVARNHTVGRGRLFISYAGLGISIPFWVKRPEEEAYRVVLPGYYSSPPHDPVKEKLAPASKRPRWVEKFRWQVGSCDISSDIKGAALKGWLEGLGLRGAPARPPHEWRRCATCMWHVIRTCEARSTWDLRDQGEVAPRHFCTHPAYIKDGDPVPIAKRAVRFANEALAHYGRCAGANSFVWITPHRKGVPGRLQDQAIWEEGCNLHTFRGEADWSCITSLDERTVLEVPEAGTSRIYELEVRFEARPQKRSRA
ncbi:MAG: hypothetical protein K6U74_18775 [Firmicutes bacterium]|nr:hypothetical protein [Bacillota bacterium]